MHSFRKERKDISRSRLLKAAHFALGSYMEQEAKKEDEWRDQDWWSLYRHAAHEIEEIRRSGTITIMLHNCADLVGLSLIMLAKAMEEADYFLDEEKDD